MRLIIIRHGETKRNISGIIAGQSETELTENGVNQARLLGKRLASEMVNGVYSSDLGRARQTTEIVTQSLRAPRPIFEPLLRERSWGQFEGNPFEHFQDALAKFQGPHWEYEPPGGESLVNLRHRARRFLSSLTALEGSGTYIVSAHHNINIALISELLDSPFEEWKLFEQHNTCVNIFDVSAARGRVVCLNCTSHLAA